MPRKNVIPLLITEGFPQSSQDSRNFRCPSRSGIGSPVVKFVEDPDDGRPNKQAFRAGALFEPVALPDQIKVLAICAIPAMERRLAQQAPPKESARPALAFATSCGASLSAAK